MERVLSGKEVREALQSSPDIDVSFDSQVEYISERKPAAEFVLIPGERIGLSYREQLLHEVMKTNNFPV
jgi:hypothetical protein